MHSAVHAEILNDLGPTEEGRAQYRRRLRDQPGAIINLYFAYMLTLCALRECRDLLDNCSYLGDGEYVQPLMQRLTSAELLSNEAVQRAARNLRVHAASPSAQVWRMRMRHRDLKQIMGCVECNLCRVHGTVMCLGLGATLQLLLGSDGRGGDPGRRGAVQALPARALLSAGDGRRETVPRGNLWECHWQRDWTRRRRVLGTVLPRPLLSGSFGAADSVSAWNVWEPDGSHDGGVLGGMLSGLDRGM